MNYWFQHIISTITYEASKLFSPISYTPLSNRFAQLQKLLDNISSSFAMNLRSPFFLSNSAANSFSWFAPLGSNVYISGSKSAMFLRKPAGIASKVAEAFSNLLYKNYHS